MSALNRKSRFELPAFEAVFAQSLSLPRQQVMFVIVSSLDALLTLFLLQMDGIYESNPFARYFLNSWGPPGMVGFKFTLVAFVCFISHIIACMQIQTARRLLNFASIIVFLVVVYSTGLLLACV